MVLEPPVTAPLEVYLTDGGSAILQQNLGHLYVYPAGGGDGLSGSATYITPTFQILSMASSGSSITYARNGVADTAAGISGAVTLTTIGAFGSSFRFGGDLAEMI